MICVSYKIFCSEAIHKITSELCFIPCFQSVKKRHSISDKISEILWLKYQIIFYLLKKFSAALLLSLFTGLCRAKRSYPTDAVCNLNIILSTIIARNSEFVGRIENVAEEYPKQLHISSGFPLSHAAPIAWRIDVQLSLKWCCSALL